MANGKITVIVENGAYGLLEKIAKTLDAAPADVLSDALSVYNGMIEFYRNGKSIYIRNGQEKRIMEIEFEGSLGDYIRKLREAKRKGLN